MRINIFVVVSERQFAMLLLESFSAGVVFARWTIAISSPIAHGSQNIQKTRIISDDSSSFAHGYVMSGVETHSCNVPECSSVSAFVFRAQRVAVIFNQPQIVFAADIKNLIYCKRIPERVRDKNRFCIFGD